MRVRIDQPGDNRSPFGIKALRLGPDERSRDLRADQEKFSVFHRESYRFRLLRVHGIDIGVFDDEVRDLSAGQRDQR